MKKHLIVIIVLYFSFFSTNAQKNEINPNGYNKFYFPDKSLSSEGTMKNGEPFGVWKSYYPNGKMKSIGKRVGEKLDSVWTFYDENGFETKKISYNNGMKNGYCFYYKIVADSIGKKNVLVSKELMLNDRKNGKSIFYNDKGQQEYTTNFKDDRKNGEEIHYAEDGRIILILKYNNGNLVDSEKLNRKDSQGRKQGIWKEFYTNGKIKVYANYLDNHLHGYYREYDESGQIIVNKRYKNGTEQTETVLPENEKREIREIRNNEGKIVSKGVFKNEIPVGIHTEYDINGEPSLSKIYGDSGIVESSGKIDLAGKKQGLWKNFYPDGTIQSEGNYENGYKEGDWIFYFSNKKVEQKGNYKKGRANGNWIWYFENGNVRRTGSFSSGSESGNFVEVNEFGDTLSAGNYTEGMKNGTWKIAVNDHIEIGNYLNDKEDGIWKYFYKNGNLEFEGNFVSGLEEGKHKFYYENGKLKETRNYVSGIMSGVQKKYTQEGDIETVTEYQNGKKYKIDGKKVKTFKE